MSKALRIGVFGGTFDPIHHVHLDIARAAREEAGLDRVLFVVAAEPPHKRGATCAPAEDRYRMVERALEGEPGLEASRIEMDREGPSYTVDTLEQLRERCPDAELFLILGVDSLADLPKWRDPDRIRARACILAVPRPGAPEIPAELEGSYRLLHFVPSPVSSTEVRQRIADGTPLDDLIPAPVKSYILEKGLYDACPTGRPR